MSNEVEATSAMDLAELKELLGPPPVLSTETKRSYDEIFAQLMRCMNPNDFLEKLLIKQLVDSTWEMIRYGRHKTLTIERQVRRFRNAQAQRIKRRAEIKQALERAAAENVGKPATELERVAELEDVVDGHVEDVDEILNRPPDELDHARALEASIVYHERLDRLLNAAVLLRNDALRQLEQYRKGLGRRLRQISDEIFSDEIVSDEVDALIESVEAERWNAAQQRQIAAPLVPKPGETP